MTEDKQQVSKYPTTFYRVSLKAIIRNEKGEVLVCKEYDSTSWSLPGGGIDYGETEKEALVRELNEEVGYVGNLAAKPLATTTFWVESKRTWLMWVAYDVIPENYDFKVGEYSNDVSFIDVRQFKGSEHRDEKWIYEYFSANNLLNL